MNLAELGSLASEVYLQILTPAGLWLGQGMLGFLIGGLALAILAQALLRLFPTTNAATRSVVYQCALIFLLLVPIGATAIGLYQAQIGQTENRRALNAVGSESQVLGNTPLDPTGAEAGKVPTDRAEQSTMDRESGAASSLPDSWMAALAAAKPTLGLMGILLAVFWLAATLRLLAMLLVASGRTVLLFRSSTPAPLATTELVGTLSQSSRAIRIRTSSEVQCPACIGTLRPWIAVPPSWPGQLSAETQRNALLHELAHARRRDGLAVLLQRLAVAVLALHPVAWWLSRRIDEEREVACDDWATSQAETTPESYGQSLLECVEALQTWNRSQPSNLFALGYFSGASQLKKRVIRMTDKHQSHSATLKRSVVFSTLLLLVSSVLAAATLWPSVPSISSMQALAEGAVVAVEPGQAGRLETRARNSRYWKDARSADDAPLYGAIRRNDHDRVRELLDLGEPVNQPWPGDGSPLIVAVRSGHQEIVQLLLDRGADVDLGVGGDGTPLIQAAAMGSIELVELLLNHGADLDAAGEGGDGNPLIQASLNGEAEMARMLIERGAVINIHVPDDDTPLINAAQQGHLEVVQLLLDAGADPNLTGDFDRRLQEIRTPLNQARKGGHDDVERVLRAAGANG